MSIRFFLTKQKKECELLEEQMGSLKKTMLEQALRSETDRSNVVTRSISSQESISTCLNVGLHFMLTEGRV